MTAPGEPGDASTAAVLRLFVAITLPDAWQSALTDVQERLRRSSPRLRFARPEGIHLTLAFLGNVERSRIESLKGALSPAVRTAAPFGLELGATGVFGPPRRPRVVWAGVHGDLDALNALQGAVARSVEPPAFRSEGRPFRPHLTLARVPERLALLDTERIAPAVAALPLLAAPPLHVDSVALMQSTLLPGGARYTEIGRWVLARER